MVAACLRELAIMTRRTPFIAVMAVHAALLAAFLLIWGDGVPLLAGSVYEQTRLADWILLAALLPWTAVRVAADERGDDIVRLSSVTGLAPAHLVAGKLAAAFAALWLIVLSAAPVMIRAQAMSAAPLARVLHDEAAFAVFAAMVGVVAAAWLVACRDRLARWLAAAATTAALLVIAHVTVRTSLSAAALFAVITAAVGVALVRRADASWRYLVDREA
jgi:hypothetical protein